ncbi:hypothetical protein FZEAL_4608 [Fusarium zealandicum]|uniref:Uncharacterized protein n=1 Tax=Fusarium zealandicum TaxID=1053134 RepID=A0A8H4ULC9_9HYPO|nr:hypothetical protein FZEAL_4608 [Fusarium zealandicum]
MCLTIIAHFTRCDTRRPVLINAETGASVFHPLETPAPCEHLQLPRARYAQCPIHGECCHVGKIEMCTAHSPDDMCYGWQPYHLVVPPGYMEASGLLPHLKPIDDWNTLDVDHEDFQGGDMDIRRDFFNLGAGLYEYARRGESIVDYLLGGNTDSPEQEEYLVRQHGSLYSEWTDMFQKMSEARVDWENLARVGCMEACPAQDRAHHPWETVFQDCPKEYRGFPMFKGIPFCWLENIERQDDILRFHPYYSPLSTRISESDRLWLSQGVPSYRVDSDWGRFMDDVIPHPLLDDPSSERPWVRSNIPPWELDTSLVEEEDIEFRDVDWTGPAMTRPSPIQSPRGTIVAPPEASGYLFPLSMESTSLTESPVDSQEDPFGDTYEAEWYALDEEDLVRKLPGYPCRPEESQRADKPNPLSADAYLCKRKRQDSDAAQEWRPDVTLPPMATLNFGPPNETENCKRRRADLDFEY